MDITSFLHGLRKTHSGFPTPIRSWGGEGQAKLKLTRRRAQRETSQESLGSVRSRNKGPNNRHFSEVRNIKKQTITREKRTPKKNAVVLDTRDEEDSLGVHEENYGQ